MARREGCGNDDHLAFEVIARPMCPRRIGPLAACLRKKLSNSKASAGTAPFVREDEPTARCAARARDTAAPSPARQHGRCRDAVERRRHADAGVAAQNFPFVFFHSARGGIRSMVSQCSAILPFSMRYRS